MSKEFVECDRCLNRDLYNRQDVSERKDVLALAVMLGKTSQKNHIG